MARSVKFEVFGKEYSLTTEVPEEDLQEILEMVRSHLQESCRGEHVIPASVVLASLNLAGKYVRMKRDFETFRREVDNSAERLRKKIEEFSSVG